MQHDVNVTFCCFSECDDNNKNVTTPFRANGRVV
uniref:Uncharacterized protein n=1 Tax=viral metagenome TaxID=1070528 RepID=A0A6C0F1V4_9ZZZZ